MINRKFYFGELIIKKFFLNLAGYDIDKAICEIDAIKVLSKDEFWLNQKQKRAEIFQYHFNKTKWYKKFVGNQSSSSWFDIPVITKKDLQNFSAKIDLKKNNFGRYLANTSGSSGTPFYFIKNKYCHSIAWANIIHSYLELGLNLSSMEARFFGHIKNGILSKYFYLYRDKLLRRYTFNVFSHSDQVFFDYLKKFKTKKFEYIYGYSSTIYEFSKFLIRKDIVLYDLCPSLRCCILTAEMSSQDERGIINEALGVTVYNEYGASEVSIIAIENKKHDWLLATNRLWIEILNEDNLPVKEGEEGKIVITDLYNTMFPFVRYQIGDVGSMKSINRYPFLKLKSLSGRISDIIRLPSGRTAPGLTFYYISRSILEKSNSIKEFKIIQKELDSFLFQIVASKEISNSDKKKIILETENYLEPGLKIAFHICNTIEKKYSEKTQHFFSELN